MTRIPVNGIELNVEVTGEGPALLMLHGFTGDLTTWDPFIDHPAFAPNKKIRVDIIGHGKSDSPEDPARYSMDHAVSDLKALLDHLGVDRFALLGYSMGGRLALHLALADPTRLWALVLESASPGIPDADDRQGRQRSDASLADSIGRNGVETFIERWQDQPMFKSQERLPEDVKARQRAVRIANSEIGLANSLRGMGAGQQEFLLPRLSALRVPALLQAGSLDSRYVILAEAMQREMPIATVQVINDAGHAPHLEQPEEFANAVSIFLALSLSDDAGNRHMEEQHGRSLG